MASLPSSSSLEEGGNLMGEEAVSSASINDATVTVLPLDGDPQSNTGPATKQGLLSLCTRRAWIVSSLVVLVAVVAVVLVATLYGTGTIGGPGALTPTTAAAASGGGGLAQNEVTESYRNRYTSFRTTILRHTDPTAFTSLSSPQSKALTWLVTKDTALVTDRVSDERLLQRYAIMSIYYACGGDEWKGFPTPLDELTDRSECLFRGVACDDQGRVVKLDWYGSNVVGQLPDEIGLLTSIQELDLSSNLLQGTIPRAILTKLTSLERLYLNDNEFSSTISTEIVNLLKLEELDLDSNFLTGPWPSSLTQLTSLKSLSLYKNDITGPLFNHLASWPNLEALYVDSTRVTGTLPSDLGSAVPGLRKFVASDVDLSGYLPSDFGLLTHLEELVLACSNFQDTIPSQIGQLTNLTSLTFSRTKGNGAIPTEMGLLTELTSLILEDNLGLVGTVPQELESLTRLEKLAVSRNNLSGTIPSGFGSMTNLQVVEFLGNLNMYGSLDFFCFVETIAYECYFDCNCCNRLCDSSQFDGNRPPQRD